MEIFKIIFKVVLFVIILALFFGLVAFSNRKNSRFENIKTKKEYNKYGTILLILLAICCYLLYLLNNHFD